MQVYLASFYVSFPCCVSIGTCKPAFFASPWRLLVVISCVMIVMHVGSSVLLHAFTRACASTPCCLPPTHSSLPLLFWPPLSSACSWCAAVASFLPKLFLSFGVCFRMSALRAMAWPVAFALAYPATKLAAAVWCLPASGAVAFARLLVCSPALFCLSYTGRRRSVCKHAWLCCILLVLLILWCPSPSSPCRASLSVPVLRFACLSGFVFRCLPLPVPVPVPLPLPLPLSLSLLAWSRCNVFRLGGHVLLSLVQLGCTAGTLRGGGR